MSGQDREKVAREDVVNPLAGFYETQDHRWVRLGMVQPDLYWSRFCQAIERPDLDQYPSDSGAELLRMPFRGSRRTGRQLAARFTGSVDARRR